MLNEKRPLLVAVVSIVFPVSLSIVLKGRGQTELKQPSAGLLSQTQSDQNAKQLDDAATPIVDLANPNTADRIDKNARKLKNARHDKSGPVKIDSYANGGEVRSDPEYRAGFSDLPADKSDIIVEAVVGDSKAFLSDDRTGIYSEFTIIVSKILKVASGFSINLGDKIVTERFGGKVRFPTGEVVLPLYLLQATDGHGVCIVVVGWSSADDNTEMRLAIVGQISEYWRLILTQPFE